MILLLRLLLRLLLQLLLLLVLLLRLLLLPYSDSLLWVPQSVELGANLTKNSPNLKCLVCGRETAA